MEIALQMLARDRIHKSPEQDHASREYARAVMKSVAALVMMGPTARYVNVQHVEVILDEKLTTSFASLMSTQSSLNSHTSRNSTCVASAKAFASSADWILKRSTTSPPYLASSVEGGAGVALVD